MGRKYQGFGLREVETEKGILFKRKVKEEFFSRIRVDGDNFTDAQQTLCNKMAEHNITVAIITPYWREE
jgi:endonuclease V-like protein UPF0215 family